MPFADGTLVLDAVYVALAAEAGDLVAIALGVLVGVGGADLPVRPLW